MPTGIDQLKHIVVLMMENRSFDHMLGYLALPKYQHPNFAQIDGLQNARAFYAHDAHPPRRLQGLSLDPDPPHEREDIARQINDPLKGPMRGFVDSYSLAFEKYRATSPNPTFDRCDGILHRDRGLRHRLSGP